MPADRRYAEYVKTVRNLTYTYCMLINDILRVVGLSVFQISDAKLCFLSGLMKGMWCTASSLGLGYFEMKFMIENARCQSLSSRRVSV